MSEQTKLEYLKELLKQETYDETQWVTWLSDASGICFIAARILEKFEPYAVSEISQLREAEEYLLGLKDELEEGVT